MRIARESLPYLATGMTVGVAGLVLGFPWLSGTALALSGCVALFFRDPARDVPQERGIIVSPADGRVTELARSGPHGPTRVSIFLSLFDVHINRSPVTGRIERTDYRPGRFLPANAARASLENERNEITLSTEFGLVRVAQIAGVLARRIVCWKKAGDDVAAGERIGLIQFGSRVEVLLPPGITPTVSLGSRVKGGSSVLARAEFLQATGKEDRFAQATIR